MDLDCLRISEGFVRKEKEYERLKEALNHESCSGKTSVLPHVVNGLSEGAVPAFMATVISDFSEQNPLSSSFCLVPDDIAAASLVRYLNAAGLDAVQYPSRTLNFHNITASHEFEHERLSVLYSLTVKKSRVIVSSPSAALLYTMPPDRFLDLSVSVREGGSVDLEGLIHNLVAGGYIRVDLLEGPGQFSIRGGIVDIFSPASGPFRMELFGDEIDRLGVLDVETQRMTSPLEEAVIIPSREIVPDKDAVDRIKRSIEKLLASDISSAASDSLREELSCLESVSDGGATNFADKYVSIAYRDKTCLLDYLNRGDLVISRDSNSIQDNVSASEWNISADTEFLLEEGLILPEIAEFAKPGSSLDPYRTQCHNIVIDTFFRNTSGARQGGLYTFLSKHTVSYCDKYPLLVEDLENYTKFGWHVVLGAEGESGAKSVSDSLRNDGFIVINSPDYTADTLPGGTVLVLPAEEFNSGFELSGSKFAFLTTLPDRYSLKKRPKRNQGKSKRSAEQRILSYADLTEGDYVVHQSYGIGRYEGIENITVAGVTRDYIKITYAGSDRLFIPTDQLDVISKYIGAHTDDGQIRLSKLGGTEWKTTSAKAKASAKKMAAELIKLYAERTRTPGYAFPPDDDLCREFNSTFEFEETESQLIAEKEIKSDMEERYPMDRLLCGDVGYGKTEVALRAAMKCILAGKQVALLVPTTILAYQHLSTAESRMRQFSVKAEMISRFRTAKEQAEILRRVKRGDIDLLIGTHRILSSDIEFKDLGLLIIDEEQRFGVAQKEKIKQFARNVDVLTLSATPIPRTLNMAMSGIRDMSILDEAPGERLPVQTYVLEHDDMIIAEAIRKELMRGGQVFYLYNRVETISSRAVKLREEFPEARIAVAHGKMDKTQLEDIWQSVLAGDIDILVSTTIIETGIDIPNANTLIIENADRMGLAQLHQIRGRVGRSHRRAYAYLTYPKGKAISEIAEKRLSSIKEFTEFGAGFKIALRDLEIRGAGNILGAEQHGHMDAIGYDLYIKLLNEAILEEKGIKPVPKTECKLEMPYNAYLSEKYIPYSAQRMEMYKKIATIESDLDFDDICGELCDRFGELPPEARNICRLSYLRALGEKAGFLSVSVRGGNAVIKLKEMVPLAWLELHDRYPNINITMLPDPVVKIKASSSPAFIDKLIDLSKDYVAELEKIGRQQKEEEKQC